MSKQTLLNKPKKANLKKYTEADYLKDTKEHIRLVQRLINDFVQRLEVRAKHHDETKLAEPEKTILMTHTPLLDEVEFGTKEYLQHLEKIKVALQHHYEHNSHHPEHYENGIHGMDLLDLVEMYFDWCATAMKYGNTIENSIRVGKDRFGLSDDLVAILRNTAERLK